MEETQPEVALRSSWKIEPMPTEVVRLPFEKAYSAEDAARIRRGLIPREMEDKWFMYLEEDVLYLHRSWTGLCIYRVALEPRADGGYTVREVLANRDPAQHRCASDEYEAALLDFLIDALLLGKPARRPEAKRERPVEPGS